MSTTQDMTQANVAARVSSDLPGFAYRAYMLGLLSTIAAISLLDRQILTILVEPIRQELGLNDSQMGLLTGLAFALVYTLGCIPIARLADRTSRRAVISVCVTFWSLMTMACGLAGGFWQLFLARMGVGLGEAGNSPSSQALIADLFPAHQRGTAMSIYLLGPPVGIALGLALGGWALANFGWRGAFLIAGVPGLAIGPLVWFTFRDVRKGLADNAVPEVDPPALVPTLRTLLSIKTLPYLIAGGVLTSLIGMGLSGWLPAFLIRIHEIPEIEVGAKLGAALGIGSILGHMTGGPLADWLGRRYLRAQLFIPIITTLSSALFALAAFTGSATGVFWLLGLQTFASGLFAAPLFAIITTLAPPWARATASAFLLFAINLVALGLGPAFIGVLSDILRPEFGEESLRYAMILSLVLAAPAAFLYFMASRHYPEDFERARQRLAGE